MTIQLCTAKIPRQRTVRGASTRPSASGCPAAGGRSPALERSAACQSTERSPSRYLAADAAIGAISKNKKTITDFLRSDEHAAFISPSSAASYKYDRHFCHVASEFDKNCRHLTYPHYQQERRSG